MSHLLPGLGAIDPAVAAGLATWIAKDHPADGDVSIAVAAAMRDAQAGQAAPVAPSPRCGCGALAVYLVRYGETQMHSCHACYQADYEDRLASDLDWNCDVAVYTLD